MHLSVVIPALNEERHLGRRLSDLRRQTRSPDEVIVVDAGSTDATVRIAERSHALVLPLDRPRLVFSLALAPFLGRLAGLIYMLVESVGMMTSEGPMIPTRYTHQQLSSMVGSNREAVTKAIGHLQGEGAIEVRGRRVYVRDFDALRRSAGE